jgi:hypothetical protein
VKQKKKKNEGEKSGKKKNVLDNLALDNRKVFVKKALPVCVSSWVHDLETFKFLDVILTNDKCVLRETPGTDEKKPRENVYEIWMGSRAKSFLSKRFYTHI